MEDSSGNKRSIHQKELGLCMNKEAEERIGGMKEGTTKKKFLYILYIKYINFYKSRIILVICHKV